MHKEKIQSGKEMLGDAMKTKAKKKIAKFVGRKKYGKKKFARLADKVKK